MLDHQADRPEPVDTGPPYDLVVVGAGIAGLNALYAARDYLGKEARVLLLDQKDAAGGMWNTAYDYVRLHQPHPMFTVGDMLWDWDRPKSHLAHRDDVRDHLAGALVPIADSFNLQTAFGHTVTSCAQDPDRQDSIRVEFHANGCAEDTSTIQARQAVFASGLDYQVADPLALSATSVISITPQDLLETLSAHRAAPVFVVGGGKTGMDTILAVLRDSPDRPVSLINGQGTNFLNRTRYIPNGIRRWTSGALISRLFRDIAMNFDGDNEDHTLAHFRRQYSTDPSGSNASFLYGLQSEEEHARIKQGLLRTYPGYLADVVDTKDGAEMILKDGSREPVPANSIFVNCTGSFFRSPALAEQRPCLTGEGRLLSITPRDGFHFLTSVTGFFATHLLFRNQLRGRGFYTLDHEALFRANRNAWVGAAATQAYMNQVISVQILPLALLDRCGLDLDRWYPLPRRLAGLIRMRAGANRDIAHCRATLDRVAARFGIQCAPLD